MGCACSGGTDGCDRQWGHSLAKDKSHSSHFATGTEPRQDVALGPSFPCTSRGTPTMEQHPGDGLDQEMTMRTSSLGSIWGPCSPPPGCGWGAEAWAGRILPACCSRQGTCLTPSAYARSPCRVQVTHQPPDPLLTRCPCLLALFSPSIELVFLQALYTP